MSFDVGSEAQCTGGMGKEKQGGLTPRKVLRPIVHLQDPSIRRCQSENRISHQSPKSYILLIAKKKKGFCLQSKKSPFHPPEPVKAAVDTFEGRSELLY